MATIAQREKRLAIYNYFRKTYLGKVDKPGGDKGAARKDIMQRFGLGKKDWANVGTALRKIIHDHKKGKIAPINETEDQIEGQLIQTHVEPRMHRRNAPSVPENHVDQPQPFMLTIPSDLSDEGKETLAYLLNENMGLKMECERMATQVNAASSQNVLLNKKNLSLKATVRQLLDSM